MPARRCDRTLLYAGCSISSSSCPAVYVILVVFLHGDIFFIIFFFFFYRPHPPRGTGRCFANGIFPRVLFLLQARFIFMFPQRLLIHPLRYPRQRLHVQNEALRLPDPGLPLRRLGFQLWYAASFLTSEGHLSVPCRYRAVPRFGIAVTPGACSRAFELSAGLSACPLTPSLFAGRLDLIEWQL